MSQVQHWCFTWYDAGTMPVWNGDKMRYMVYQAEICPDTQRKHFQGYVEFHRSQKMGAVKKALGSKTVHLEPRQGSRGAARDYCMKDDTRMDEGGPFEFGEWIEGQQGRRTDLEEVSIKVKEGKSFREIALEHTSSAIRYHKGIKVVSKVLNVKRRPQEVTNIVMYGDTLCGNWWENYDGQGVAFYDEFDGQNHMDISFFKKITDKFAVTVPYKGDSTEYVAGVNLFASNVSPIEWYPRIHWEPIKRRMNHMIYCRKVGEERFYSCDICVGECEVVRDVINTL